MSSSAAPRSTPDTAARPSDLTVNKVLAGAGAAATSAVLGSFFGAAGTVVGAALGSVASTVATVVYQRSLDRTRETLVSRFRPDPASPGEGTPDEETPAEDTESPRPTPARRRPRWGVWIAATVVVFALGLAVVTGIEWVKGSSLTTGQQGTSISRVLTPSGGSGDDGSQGSTPATTSAPSDTGTATATTTPDSEVESTASATPQPSASARPSTTTAPTSSAVPGLSDMPDGQP